MSTLELLSPAKNLQCGISAIDHGADAVYIGASRFGARVSAGNSIEDIAKLCEYAHQFDAKVYVTVNTIIYDDELDDTIELCKRLNSIGVDALLVQDMGLFTLLKGSICSNQSNDPDIQTFGDSGMTLHASTQTDNRTIEKVKWLASLGFKRVVLARELSIEEINAIHKAVPEVELEVFVHGALCVSYSGQCYASQYCFNRSANRGACAQFCRMPFTLKDADGKVLEENCHLLSLRDMAQLDNLERLAEAGAMSFKIEGRLKDEDYVKNITAAYSQRLDEICRSHPDKYQRASMGHTTYTFTPDIKKSFNRGFTTYFADGRQSNLVSFDTPKALGEQVGTVKEIRGNSFNVASTASFANGDGLCFFSKDRQLIGFRVNRAEGNRLFPLQMPRELKPGTLLYRNHDQAFQSLLAKPSAERKVEVNLNLRITKKSLILTMKDEHDTIRQSVLQYEYQKAQKPQEDNIRKQLSKLGGTIYTCQDITIDSEVESPFIPSSVLSTLRREVVESEHELRVVSHSESSESQESHIPHYSIPYLYNAANTKAKEFYRECSIEANAFECDDTPTEKVLMQCRYCLRNELGYCTKNGKKAPWKEPLTISLDDGKEFLLRFNCKNCEMFVTNKVNA